MEFGSKKMAAQPFLTPAAEARGPQAAKVIIDETVDAMDKLMKARGGMMVPLIQSILEASAQLGDPMRLWPRVAPEGAGLPYATWDVVGGAPLPQLNEPPPADGWRVRLAAAAVAIRADIERRGNIESYNPSPDDDTGAFGISFDVRLLALR